MLSQVLRAMTVLLSSFSPQAPGSRSVAGKIPFFPSILCTYSWEDASQLGPPFSALLTAKHGRVTISYKAGLVRGVCAMGGSRLLIFRCLTYALFFAFAGWMQMAQGPQTGGSQVCALIRTPWVAC